MSHSDLSTVAAIGVVRNAAIWTVVCWAAAGPSFYIAVMISDNTPQIVGAIAGVFTFVALYTVLSCLPAIQQLRRDKAARVALRATYAVRIALSAMTPIMPMLIVVDVYAGFLSTRITEPVFGGGGEPRWLAYYVLTLVQGIVLNLALLPVLALTFGVLRLAWGRTSDIDPTRTCIACGYDLRASKGRCPECGTVIPAQAIDLLRYNPPP